jgi:hypothetical protein
MHKFLSALAITCSLCGAANAAIVTFEYTAVVTIAVTDGPGGSIGDLHNSTATQLPLAIQSEAF